MKKKLKIFYLIILLGFYVTTSFAQEFVWQAGFHSFFDNIEFSQSAVKSSQTMAGVRFTPQLGFSYQDKHRVFVGFDAMHEFGSDKSVEFRFPVAYYNFESELFAFYMGAFPRKTTLDKYPRMFFQDSVGYYRPVINGILWEIRSKKDDYFNVWLDWTSRQSYENRETFFMGLSSRYNLKMFYIQQFIYMFHFAGSMNPQVHESLHDNGLILTSAGMDWAENTNFEKLELNIGWSVGLERNRGGSDGWKKPHGLLSELMVEYKGVGVFNTFYSGQRQQSYYKQYQNRLYWGDPTYRVSRYNRADFYAYFIKNSTVSVKFIYSLHFLEKRMYHEQILYAAFNLDNLFQSSYKNLLPK